MTTTSLDILIAGGGICGLSCAIALRRAGHTVRVLERSQFTNEVGAAVTVPPNASRVLQSWDFDFHAARMIKFYGVDFVAGEAGGDTLTKVGELEFSDFEERFGAPYFLSHRVDLHEALKGMANSPNGPGKPAQIINGAHIISYDADACNVTLANGSTLNADLIIAADGVHSIASKYVGTHRPAIPSDTTVVRFLIPTSTLEADPATVHMITGDGTGAVYTSTSRTRYLLRYPCRNNTLQNFGFYFTNNTAPSSSSLTPASKTARSTLLSSLSTFHPAITSTVAKASSVLPHWTCLSRAPSPQMFRGRLVLAGDAGHAMLPHLGQGAALSIEDAGALGILLSGIVVENGGDDVGEIIAKRLQLFESVRKERVMAVQILSSVPGLGVDFAKASVEWEKYLPGHKFLLH